MTSKSEEDRRQLIEKFQWIGVKIVSRINRNIELEARANGDLEVASYINHYNCLFEEQKEYFNGPPPPMLWERARRVLGNRSEP